jgi:hypothetical protein
VYFVARERIQRNLDPQILLDSILLPLLDMVILLTEEQRACVFAVLFIMIRKLERKIPQRKVSAVTSCAIRNQGTKFKSQVCDLSRTAYKRVIMFRLQNRPLKSAITGQVSCFVWGHI